MARMKSVLSLALIASLVTSAFPVTAKERAETPRSLDLRGPGPTAGPIARAVTREAVRLAGGGEPRSSGGTPAESNWSRVRDLAPGTDIVVTVKGSLSAQRYLVAGNESDLSVLNLTDTTLPAAAKKALRDIASHRPESFSAAQKGEMFVVKKNVRMGPDGVFVADEKVADLGQVVEHIARTDVVEISALAKPPIWHSVKRHSRIGVLAGAMIGAVLGISAGGDSQCRSECIPVGAVVGAGALIGLEMGAIVGTIVGTVAGVTNGKALAVVYRAPTPTVPVKAREQKERTQP